MHEEPIFTVDQLKPKWDLINKEYNRLKSIKKPKNETINIVINITFIFYNYFNFLN